MKSSWILLIFSLTVACGRDGRTPLQIAQLYVHHYQQMEFESVMPLLVDSTREALRHMVSDIRRFPMDWPDSSEVMVATLQEVEFTASVLVESWRQGRADTASLQLLKCRDGWRVIYRRYDPAHVARSFLEAFHAGIWQQAAQFTDEASLRDLEVAAQYYKAWKGPEVNIVGVEFNEDKSKAMVSYLEKGNEMVKLINLIVDEEGHWKVSLSKKATF